MVEPADRSSTVLTHTRVPRSRTPARAFPVDLVLEEVDGPTGLRTRSVVLGDESDSSATRDSSRAAFAAQDRLLREHPAWTAPAVDDGRLVLTHDVSRWVYASPTMRQWRTHLVPTARALYVLQRPHESHLLPGWGPVDGGARRFIVDGLDAVGIRTRARVMQDVVGRTLAAAPRGGRSTWTSLACGAAVPVLDALAEHAHHAVDLRLVDIDTDALDFAAQLAEAQGLRRDVDYHLLERNLVSTVVARSTLVDELGEASSTVVDALGIFEYFSDASCVRLLRNTYRLVRPGGVLVFANMRTERPELALNQRGLGWPHIVPRSTEQLVDILRRAGLPLHRTTVSIPQDGVYAVVDVTR